MTIDRTTFESIYAGQPRWEIGPTAAGVHRRGRSNHRVNFGFRCGTGENAFFFANRGHKVTGIDFLEEPIKRAKHKALERG